MKERKLKKRRMKEDPAVVVAAFGTATAGRLVYERFDSMARKELGEPRLAWAYTSEIIREKTGLPGLLQTLSALEAEGYRRVAVQPLHVFPATEYQELIEVSHRFPGLRVAAGETLLHRWHFVNEVFDTIAVDFLSPEEGVNLVVAHGTPLCADPSNAIYHSLYNYLPVKFGNVFLATVEGMPERDIALKTLSTYVNPHLHTRPRARIIPFMLVSGVHVQHDLIGSDNSFKSALQDMGYEVDYVTVEHGGQSLVKTLGLYDGVCLIFVSRIKRALDLLRFY